MENFFKVSSTSHSTSVAGAIAKSVRDGKSVVLQSIGAGAINQAVKAIAIARGYLIDDHLDIVFVCEFIDLDVEGNARTAIRFHVNQPGSAFPPATPIPKRAELEGNAAMLASDRYSAP